MLHISYTQHYSDLYHYVAATVQRKSLSTIVYWLRYVQLQKTLFFHSLIVLFHNAPSFLNNKGKHLTYLLIISFFSFCIYSGSVLLNLMYHYFFNMSINYHFIFLLLFTYRLNFSFAL